MFLLKIISLISKLKNDYSKEEFVVNSTIRYETEYKGYKVLLYYTMEDEMENSIRVEIIFDNQTISWIIPLQRNDNKYIFRPYIPNDIYQTLLGSIIIKDEGYSPIRFFETIINHILENDPVTTVPIYKPKSSKNENDHHDDKVFFRNMKRVKMSQEMKEKILDKYEASEAERILNYCGSTLTLCFTANKDWAKDITLYIE